MGKYDIDYGIEKFIKSLQDFKERDTGGAVFIQCGNGAEGEGGGKGGDIIWHMGVLTDHLTDDEKLEVTERMLRAISFGAGKGENAGRVVVQFSEPEPSPWFAIVDEDGDIIN